MDCLTTHGIEEGEASPALLTQSKIMENWPQELPWPSSEEPTQRLFITPRNFGFATSKDERKGTKKKDDISD